MPNYCSNELNVTGRKAELRRFVETSTRGYLIKAGDPAVARDKGVELKQPGVVGEDSFTFGALTGVSDDFAHDWDNEAFSRWGTKWEAMEPSETAQDLLNMVESGRLSIDFTTAWGPPEEWLKEARRQFPALKITLMYIPEGYSGKCEALPLPKKPKTQVRPRPKAKQQQSQGVVAGPLAGRVFCFTGRLEGMARAEAEGKVRALGAATADSITKKVTDVVVGEDAGSKRAKALEMGLEVHDQGAFDALLRSFA